ncbi:MAG: hypothetical protein ABF497_05540 [Sporolactobacillus sp.]
MKKYECTKRFYAEKYDNDECETDEEIMVDKGSQWVEQESTYRITGGEVRLENEDAEWLELSKEMVAENFKEMV